MLRNGNLTSTIALALVVIFTAAGSSMAGSLVLCVGSDGHADLERAFENCCVEDQRAGHDNDSPTSLVDSCGSCSDLDLDTTPLTKQRQRLEAPHTIVVGDSLDATVCATSVVAGAWETIISPPDLISISSVVFLT